MVLPAVAQLMALVVVITVVILVLLTSSLMPKVRLFSAHPHPAAS